MTERVVALLRHATAAHAGPSGRDADRELAPLGHQEMALVGRHLAALAAHGLRFDHAVASPARRTWQTAELALAALGPGAPALLPDASVYEAHEVDLVRILEARPGNILLVGHNPAISDLAQHLTGDRRIHARGMAKAGLVVARLDGPVVPASVLSHAYVTPADLAART